MGSIGAENRLDKIRLSSTQIEEQITDYSLSFPSTRRRDVEWGMKLPMFVPSFHKYVIGRGVIPRQNEFWELYLSDNESDSQIRRLSPEQREGLKARVYRAYPSLVRDIHFALLLRESGKFDEVVYNEDLDIIQGVDLIVVKNGDTFAVNLYTNTRRAHRGRSKKQFRHEELKEVKNIELPISFRGSKQCGAFFLYSSRELEKLEELIQDYTKHS